MKYGVLQILHGLQRAGVERLVYDLTLANRREIETVVVCLDHEGPLADDLRRQGISVYHTHRRVGLDFRQIFRIGKIIRSFNPQVIHCHQYTPFFYGSLASLWTRKGRIVFTEHGRHFPDAVGWKRQMVNRFLSRKADRITAVCKFTRDRLIKNEALPENRIEIIYNGVDLSRFETISDRQEARTRLGLPADSRIVVQVGTFRAVKDQASAINAFRIVHEHDADAILVFVGDGPDLPSCRKLAEQLGLGEAVRFLGQREDIPEILSSADVMLMTSLSEAHSVSLLEAMARRLPIVATNVGGIPETLVNHETGLLVEAKDVQGIANALLQLLRNPDLRTRMGQAGYDRVQKYFQQSQMHQRYLKIYRDLVGNGERG
ncbi:MAG: GT4 family glycosyltransferase PelF [Phycisphaerae bacterium]